MDVHAWHSMIAPVVNFLSLVTGIKQERLLRIILQISAIVSASLYIAHLPMCMSR